MTRLWRLAGDGAESDQSGTKEFKVRGCAVESCVSGDNNVVAAGPGAAAAAAAAAAAGPPLAPRWLTNTPHVQPRLDQPDLLPRLPRHTAVVITPSGDLATSV